MTDWDASTYDTASTPQQAWAGDVLDRLAPRLAPDAAVLDVGCGIARVQAAIDEVTREHPELDGWSPWVFAAPHETEARLVAAGFTEIRCTLQERPTDPEDLEGFVRSSIL